MTRMRRTIADKTERDRR